MTPSAILLLLSALINLSDQSGFCEDDFCPPPWIKQRSSGDDVENSFSIHFGTDPQSGCRCKEVPAGSLVVCFGRQTCQSFPKTLNITQTQFRIKATSIKILKTGDLSNMQHLQNLKIEGNFILSEIQEGTFRDMKNVRNLSISYNDNLKRFREKTFDGLVNLRELFLVKNGFNEVKAVTQALSRSTLPNLFRLELSENQFLEISKDTFETMRNSTVEELSLILCQIEDIHPQVFLPLTNLKILRLGENSFNSSVMTSVVEKSLSKLNLKSLNLYSTGLRKSPPKPLLLAIGKSSISHLSLAKNQFEIISSDTFPFMPNIKVLDLREVLALNITNNAFTGLPNLKTLLLSGNKLSSIPEGVLLEQLSYLDLQDNSGDHFKSAYFSIYGLKFITMKNLKSLNLSFNAIHAVYNSSFVGLENLRVLGLKNATLYQIFAESFAPLKNLVFLDLQNNPLAKSVSSNGLQKDVFKGLENLKILLLGGCQINFINKTENPFENLKNLVHLGLERNKLATLDGIDVLTNLATLDVSSNYLQTWKTRFFSDNLNLRDLRLDGNKFQYLTDAMYSDFYNLTRLSLTGNPFICDCHFVFPSDKIISLMINESVFCAFPDFTANITLGEFLATHAQACQYKFLTRLSIVIPVIFFILLVLISVFLLFYYRWHLRYWIFLTRLYLSRKGKIKTKSQRHVYSNYIYDAFVSYCNEDRNFVIRLVTMLENYAPFLKLCVYERDFQIGTIISENVLESVAQSRKTLLIISDSYAKSQWCRWESQIAEHHRLFFQGENGEFVDDSLVLIKLGPVSEAHLTPTLKFLLKTRIYLQWDGEEKKQKVFWEKLRAALAPPRGEVVENTYL